MVDGNGQIRHLPDDGDGNHDDILKAAQVNLGLFGVILEFTVKVKPMSNCKVDNIFSMKMEVKKSTTLLMLSTIPSLEYCGRMIRIRLQP